MKWRRSLPTGKWKTSDQGRLFKLLGDLYRSGFSLQQALTFLLTINASRFNDLPEILAKLKRGYSFSDAVVDYVEVDLLYQLRIAEEHGQFGKCLERLGQLMAMRAEQSRKFKQLLRYPVFLLGLVLLIALGLQRLVIPRLNEWSERGHPAQPSIHWWLIGLFLFLLSGFAIIILMKQSHVVRLQFYCQLPIIGKIWRYYYAYYLTQNLSMLVGSGLGIHDIVKLTCQFSDTSVLGYLGRELARMLDTGQSPLIIVDRYSFIPKELTVLLTQGNSAPDLARELGAFSKLQYQYMVQAVEQGLGLIQPILFGIIGLAIVGTYLSLLLPMYHTIGGV
ncbi:type II secretion system F family protein [Levilactobacillus bambusae]|uniref:Type II secretion system protein GspF domain-containing protein n=1 Tax=Levilactobacillus bambusae TaxID=2024736 RepID=A0A2V1MX57_9LACO|nr:type II secretion system F family protein [Levilactobacillus bambusae]PWF99606.1 hypothetical protein DCM90_09200 [Levilactobacillus bambusae]